MNNRQTLGILTSDHLNSRKSMGNKLSIKTPHKTPSHKQEFKVNDQRLSYMGSRTSVSNNRMSSTGRPSTVGSNRQSILNTAQKRKNTPQDRRPISDKEFMKESVNIILKYLDTHGFTEPISPKDLLSSPSTKTYSTVFLFLYNQIDPLYKYVGKPHDDIPEMLKLIGYPINISKRSFLSVGGLHVWPSLLATLSWMVELLIYSELFKSPQYEIEFEPNEQYDMIFTECRDRLFFEYVRGTYSIFLSGENDFSALEEQYKNIFDTKNEQYKEDSNQILSQNEMIEHQIEEEKKKSIKLEELEKLKQTFETDISNHNKGYEEVNKFLLMASERSKTIAEKLVEIQKDINMAQEDKRSLENKLNEQIKNEINFQHIIETKKMLDEKIYNSENKLQQNESRLNELEINLSKSNNNIKSKLDKYNSLANQLQLVPQKNLNDPNFELYFECHTSSVRTQNGETSQTAEISKNIIPLLSNLKKKLSSSLEKLSEENEQISETVLELQETLQEKHNDLKDSQLKFEILEKNYQNKKNSLNEELSALRNNAHKKQKQIENARDDIENKLRGLKGHIENLKECKLQEEQRCNLEKTEYQNKITKILEQLYSHKEHVQNHLKIVQIKQSNLYNQLDI